MRKLIILYACLSMMGGTITCAFAQSSDSAGKKGTSHSYAMVVGISNYKYIRPLSFADKDAQLFRDFLQSPGGGSLPDDNIFCLLNEDARAANFWVKGMSWLRSKQLKKGDRLYIYLAGHGDAISSDEYFFLTYDCNPAGDKNNYIVTGNIQLFNLKSRIAALTGSGVEVLLIMDACRSNELPGGAEGQRFLSTAVSEKGAGETVMLAAAAGQESIEDSRIGTGHGLFTYYLIDGLSGLADRQGNGMITLSKIQSWVTGKVQTEALQKYHHEQKPYFCCTTTGDKVIARVDSAFLKQWTAAKQLKTQDNDIALRYVHDRSGATAGAVVDTQLVELYNRFTSAVKRTDLIGDSSADTWYQQMATRFPQEALTADAKYTLVTEWIDFAQQRINLTLQDEDSITINRMLSQFQQSAQSQELQQRMSSLRKITTQENTKIANMLGRAIELIRPEDSALARALLPKYYYFKAMASIEVVQGNVYDLTAGRQDIARAYSLDTGSAYLQLGLAELYLYSAQLDSALKYGLIAIHKAPRWARAYTTVGRAYSFMGNSSLGRAKAYLRKALALDPKSYVTLCYIGELENDHQQFDSAAMTFRKMITLYPEQALGYLSLGSVKLRILQNDSANQYFQRALALGPNQWQIYHSIASEYGNNQILDSAQKYLRLALFLNPYESDLYEGLGDIANGRELPDTALYYYHQGNILDPQWEQPYVQMAGVYAQMGRSDTALLIIRRTLAINRSANALYNTGLIFTTRPASGDSVMAYMHEALKVDSSYGWPYDALSVQSLMNGNVDSALIFSKQAVRLQPSNGAFLENMAIAYTWARQKDSAEAYYKAAILYNLFPSRVEANLAWLYISAGQQDSALLYLRVAIQHGGNDFRTLQSITNCFANLGQKDSALRYLAILRATPAGKTLNDEEVGNMYVSAQEFDSAIVYLQRAVDKHSYGQRGLYNLGSAYIRKKDLDKALEIFLRYSKEYPPFNGVDYNIACIYSLQGKKPQALSWLEISIQHGFKDYKHIVEDTDLTNIHQEPAFTELLKKYFPAEPGK